MKHRWDVFTNIFMLISGSFKVWNMIFSTHHSSAWGALLFTLKQVFCMEYGLNSGWNWNSILTFLVIADGWNSLSVDQNAFK